MHKKLSKYLEEKEMYLQQSEMQMQKMHRQFFELPMHLKLLEMRLFAMLDRKPSSDAQCEQSKRAWLRRSTAHSDSYYHIVHRVPSVGASPSCIGRYGDKGRGGDPTEKVSDGVYARREGGVCIYSVGSEGRDRVACKSLEVTTNICQEEIRTEGENLCRGATHCRYQIVRRIIGRYCSGSGEQSTRRCCVRDGETVARARCRRP